MDNWSYCLNILPKVSRTFALNIGVLRGDLHRSILTAYLFCRTIDTIEDAGKLDPQTKIRLLLEFSRILEDSAYREKALDSWIGQCAVVDGAANDLALLSENRRVFNVFDSLKASHKEQIIPSVIRMAKGMSYFQKKFAFGKLTPLENEDELEEYCYFVAGAVGEMLCNLFLTQLPGLPDEARETMKQNAVSFGLGLQMTNISKDVVVDRQRGWSYIPKESIREKGLTVEEFHKGTSMQKNLQVLEKLLQKTTGHLNDALKFTLAIPRHKIPLRLFCIWPLWMAMETVAVLHNNQALLASAAPVKISRGAVKKILRTTPWIASSNFLLKRSFEKIIHNQVLQGHRSFDLENLHRRLDRIPLDTLVSSASGV